MSLNQWCLLWRDLNRKPRGLFGPGSIQRQPAPQHHPSIFALGVRSEHLTKTDLLLDARYLSEATVEFPADESTHNSKKLGQLQG